MMKKDLFRKQCTQYLGLAALLLIGQSCSDLEPSFSDSSPTEDSSGNFSGVVNAQSSLDGLMNALQGGFSTQADGYSLKEVTSENIAVLTRGADWGDNGVWRIMHNHSWNSAHLHVLNEWNNRNQEILNATRLLDPASSAPADIVAQAQVIRAINMFSVLNLYSVVPFRGVNDGPDVNPEVLDTQTAFNFVMDDLNAAISSGNLSPDGSNGDTFSIGEATARFVRAKVLLNAERILGTAQAGAYDGVINDVNAIESLGFTLDTSESYFDIWDTGDNSEVIMHLNTFTGSRIFNQIHPNQGGWNGFVTLTETFRLFGTDDESLDARLGVPGDEVEGLSVGYLRGQQNDPTGSLTDRSNVPLVYEDVPLASLEINNERNGIRIVKYPQRGEDGRPAPTNDFVLMRLSEAFLMRAEAALRGGSGADPAADINAIRTRAGATPIGSATLDDVYDEIRREMNGEANIAGHRAVQIRFGTFSDTWELKTAQDDFRVWFPIPQQALGSNPNLVQNEGY